MFAHNTRLNHTPLAQKHECPDPFEDKVKCHECKHWIDKWDAQRVVVEGLFCVEEWFYCPMHERPYTRVSFLMTIPAGQPKYFREVEVEKDGTPVGFKKKS